MCRVINANFVVSLLILADNVIYSRKKSRLPSENVDFSTIEEDTTPLMQSEDDN